MLYYVLLFFFILQIKMHDIPPTADPSLSSEKAVNKIIIIKKGTE